MSTIFITGASTGIGKATAQFFYDKGWNVIATMRDPSKENDLKESNRMKILSLDVTDDTENIRKKVEEGINAFGKVDVLLNNAGYAVAGIFEITPKEKMKRQFDVNVFGLLEVTQALLPHFRANKAGRIINVSSIGGLLALPFTTLYHGTKYAVEGISEGLMYELAPFNVDIKLIEPGAVRTDFGGRSIDVVTENMPQEYQRDFKAYSEFIQSRSGDDVMEAIDVAKVIYEAATKKSRQFRYIVGDGAKKLMKAKKFLGGIKYQNLVRKRYN